MRRISQVSGVCVALCLVVAGVCLIKPARAATRLAYVGVNLAGAEFGAGTEGDWYGSYPGTYGSSWLYPTHEEVDYYMGKGMNTLRLPFRWERLQPTLYQPFDSAEQARMDDFVNYATGEGAYVVLDPHNYARYYPSKLIGTSALPNAAFADLWSRLAGRYKNNSRVIFGLMNEPHDMNTESWRAAAQEAINAIRNAGATQLILVPGNGWTGAHSWTQNWYGTANAVEMLKITDPGNNYAYEVHQYFDSDHSGTHDGCDTSHTATSHFTEFTNWLRQNGKKGWLGEFNFDYQSQCLTCGDQALDYLDANSDVWLGWAFWAGGPLWDCNTPRLLDPCPRMSGPDRPQMAILVEHLSAGPTPTPVPGCGTTNIALNRPTTTSSIEMSGYEGGKAVDGNTGTRWSSQFSDPQWIYIDLGSTQNICRVKLNWETAYGKTYKIQVSNDAGNWMDIYSTTSGDGGVDDLTGLSGSGRYVRMYGTQRGTQWGYSLWEFEVYSGSAPQPTPTPPVNTLVIYGDSTSWENWSWGSTVNLSNTSPVYAGSRSIAVTYTSAWAGLSLRKSPAVSTSGYTKLTFWVHGGSSGTRQFQVYVQTADSGGESSKINVDAPAGQWTAVTINLSAFGNPAQIARVNFQDRTGGAQPIFYLDEIKLTN